MGRTIRPIYTPQLSGNHNCALTFFLAMILSL
jgi:hypothetical protein